MNRIQVPPGKRHSGKGSPENVVEIKIEWRRKYKKEYRSRPEVKKQERQYKKEYNSRPKSKELRKERNKKYYIAHEEEIKERLRKYGKKYYSRPEIKEKQNAYYRERYQKNKQKNWFLDVLEICFILWFQRMRISYRKN